MLSDEEEDLTAQAPSTNQTEYFEISEDEQQDRGKGPQFPSTHQRDQIEISDHEDEPPRTQTYVAPPLRTLIEWAKASVQH